MPGLSYGSVCSGIEAATVAWHGLGWTPRFFSEIDPFCCKLLQHRFPRIPNLGDIRNVTESAGPIDLLVGGTPCQDFSVAGRRAGLDGGRSGLVWEFIRIAAELQPRWLVWENVPGVLSQNGGRDFRTITAALEECGYGWAYRVLDAQHFGVPQRRRRVFLVGYLGDWRPPAAVLFERESLQGRPAPRRTSREDIAPTIAERTSGGGGLGSDAEIDGALVVMAHGQANAEISEGCCPKLSCVHEAPIVAHPLLAMHNPSWDHTKDNFVTHTLTAEGHDASEDGTGRGLPLVPFPILESGGRCGRKADKRDGLGIGAVGDPMFTLQAGKQHAVAFESRQTPNWPESKFGTVLSGHPQSQAVAWDLRGRYEGAMLEGPHGTVNMRASSGGSSRSFVESVAAVRRITPLECERLQGFPDGWTRLPKRVYATRRITPRRPADMWDRVSGGWILTVEDTPRYRALGNSMAVPVMYWLGHRISIVEALL